MTPKSGSFLKRLSILFHKLWIWFTKFWLIIKMGCSLFFSRIWPKNFRFSKLVYGMDLLSVWSIWVGWLMSYPWASPRFGPFCWWSQILAMNPWKPNFGSSTPKSEKFMFFIFSCENTMVVWLLTKIHFFWNSIPRLGRGHFSWF